MGNARKDNEELHSLINRSTPASLCRSWTDSSILEVEVD